ncbi:MAG: LPXTG cell wall anchor domain-containing protein, partial [Firmicutes bacterium]|nr:LPXTG cell wall anchor domain-containing protein [Bacillota bacterium]
TGDTTNVVPYACGLGAGLLGLIALLLRKKRGSDK